MTQPTTTPTPPPLSGDDPFGLGGGTGGTDTKPNPDATLHNQLVVGPDGKYYRVVWNQTPGGQKSLVLVDPNNPAGPAIPMSAGEYWTADHRRWLVDQNGNALSKPDNISESEWQGAFGKYGSDGSDSTHVAQPYGYNAPDPKGAADLMMTAWAYANDLVDRGFDAQKAFAEFQAKYDQLMADTQYREEDLLAAQNRAENEDRRLREQQQAANRIAVAGEATTRGRSLLTDYLPNVIPGAQAMNFGGLRIPMMQTSPTQIFQSHPGGPGDLNAIPNINPNPAIPYRQPNLMGGLPPMPAFPTPPQYTPPPDIQALINQTQAGSGPMGWA